jgi:Nif-specific regulatory protein
MIEVQTPVVFEQTERPPKRMEVALYGIYEISKILCGPGDLHSILTTTLGVLKSFLDMGNGLIALLDEEGGVDMLVAASPDTRRSATTTRCRKRPWARSSSPRFRWR